MSSNSSSRSGPPPSKHSASTSSQSGSTSSASGPVDIKANLIALAKTIQFSWFAGHVFVLLGFFLYLITFRSGGRAANFWYRLIYAAVIESFGIIIFQTYKHKSFNPVILLGDDNVQYLLIAFLWLFYKRVTITIVPFAIFSIFHTLTYSRAYLFPALGYSAQHNISVSIGSFVRRFNDKSIAIAANFELILLLYLFLQVFLTFQLKALFVFLTYVVFIKLRYEKSNFTRNTLKVWEVRVDGLVAHPNVPNGVKQGWISFKRFIRQYLGRPIDVQKVN